MTIGRWEQLHGQSTAKSSIDQSLAHFAAAAALDPTYLYAIPNSLGVLVWLVSEARTDEELRTPLERADGLFAQGTALSSEHQTTFSNYFQIYVRAAARALLAEQDPQPWLQRAMANLAETRRRGASALDIEQHATLAHLIDAKDHVRRRQDPTDALTALQADLGRCLALASQDVLCQTWAAQAEWVRGDLQAAFAKARLATQSPEQHPDAWQTLAETHLRLARTAARRPSVREQQVTQGLAALERAFAINPNHALGLATQGALHLLMATQTREPRARSDAATRAVASLQHAIERAPYLRHRYEPLLTQARAL